MILNGLPWKRTEIILSFLRLHPSTSFQTLVDYDGYSISSKGFLPTVVDITSWLSAGNSEMKNTWCVSASPSDGEEWDSMC